MFGHRLMVLSVLLPALLGNASLNTGITWIYRVETYPLPGQDHVPDQALNTLGKQQ